MVNVIGLTKEEIEQRKIEVAEKDKTDNHLKSLTDLAKETFPFNINVYLTAGGFDAVNHASADPIFDANVKKKLIILYNKKYFDSTLKLANLYEQQTGLDWTLKKDYNE